jgi:hypothetical protein
MLTRRAFFGGACCLLHAGPALAEKRSRPPRLITLNVGFMGGTRAQKREVKQIASEWIGGGLEKHLRFVFDTPLERSHIRVGFKKGDNISAVGALARAIKSKPTMNLSPPLTRRAILHEFGHALGLRHEHHHPSGGIVSNRDAVFARYPKWSKAMIEDNIFKKFDKSYSCQGSGFDPDSVMLYQFDEEMTLNGVASKSNEYISRGDQRCLLRTYRA